MCTVPIKQQCMGHVFSGGALSNQWCRHEFLSLHPLTIIMNVYMVFLGLPHSSVHFIVLIQSLQQPYKYDSHLATGKLSLRGNGLPKPT